MKRVQWYELFRGIALKNHAFIYLSVFQQSMPSFLKNGRATSLLERLHIVTDRSINTLSSDVRHNSLPFDFFTCLTSLSVRFESIYDDTIQMKNCHFTFMQNRKSEITQDGANKIEMHFWG